MDSKQKKSEPTDADEAKREEIVDETHELQDEEQDELDEDEEIQESEE